MRGTTLRPTARGLAVILATVVLLAGSAGLGLRAPRDVAAALCVVLAVSALCLALALPGLRLHRRVQEDAVPVGDGVRVDLALAPRAVIARIPLARGTVRCALPPALGGPGVLPLGADMSHRLIAQGRGEHDLGACRIRAVDPLGMWRLSRTEHPGGSITALPRIEAVPDALPRRAGLAADGRMSAAAPGAGDIGPLARPYVPGDDLRRIHWRASARTDRLMTREDEPTAAETAAIVLDDRSHAGADEAVRERIVSLAASLWTILRAQGWCVRMLDASGEEIVAETPPLAAAGEAGAPALAADAEAVRAALLALARLRFRTAEDDGGDDHAGGGGESGRDDRGGGAVGPGPAGALLHAAPSGGITTGGVGLAVVVGSTSLGPRPTGAAEHRVSQGSERGAADDGTLGGAGLPAHLAELSPLTGRAGRRLAVAVAPGARTAPEAGRGGGWDVVELTVGTPLADALEALGATGTATR